MPLPAGVVKSWRAMFLLSFPCHRTWGPCDVVKRWSCVGSTPEGWVTGWKAVLKCRALIENSRYRKVSGSGDDCLGKIVCYSQIPRGGST